RSVAVTSGLASLLKPIWLSLICTNRSPPAPARAARSIGMPLRPPPVIVQTAPVPTHAMHFRNPRRSQLVSSFLFFTGPLLLNPTFVVVDAFGIRPASPIQTEAAAVIFRGWHRSGPGIN